MKEGAERRKPTSEKRTVGYGRKGEESRFVTACTHVLARGTTLVPPVTRTGGARSKKRKGTETTPATGWIPNIIKNKDMVLRGGVQVEGPVKMFEKTCHE